MGASLSDLSVVILCGGRGTRLREHTEMRPKPMIEIGGRPILWHIMKHYAHHGAKHFVLCLGYKGEVIRDYFLSYRTRAADVTVDLSTSEVQCHGPSDDWRVVLVDTGQESMTGSRIKRAARHLRPGTFAVTYGDGVSDVHLGAALAFHRSHRKRATVTAVRPTSRFGELRTDASGTLVVGFSEKPRIADALISGGFFFFEPGVLDVLDGESGRCVLEREPLETLARGGELRAFWHDGYWQCMDTARDWELLQAEWQGGRAPWKVWR